MGKPELAELLAIAERAAVVAWDAILPVYREEFGVETKADGTPVTLADRRAEEAIRAFLARECPGHGVLGEEFGETPGDGRHRWILDPIDGTKSFVHRVPLWGTLVALERDGEPVVGVIACHAAGETISGAQGLGAMLNGQPVRVSTTARLADAAVSTTSIQAMALYRPRGFDGVVEHARLFRTWGDCYGYLAVAAGRIEAMLDPEMSYWDLAALIPIVREAGGRITDWDGSEQPRASCVASNGLVHDELLALLAVDTRY